MKRASQHFTAEDRQRVNQAVREAESKTSAEIVPVVATASGRYDRAEDVFGLVCGAAAMAVAWLVVPELDRSPGSWGGMPVTGKLLAMVAATVAGFLVGALVAMHVAWLRRLFSPANQMRDEVQARTRQAFFDQRVHHTAGRTGLLIYVSLYERLAGLVADQAVLEKLGNSGLDDLCRHLTRALRRSGDVTGALCETIAQAGERLGAVLPRAADDLDELPDALVTID